MDVEVDDCWIALGNELVLGEAFYVEEEEGWEWVQEAIPFTCILLLGGTKTIVLREDGVQTDLVDVSYLSAPGMAYLGIPEESHSCPIHPERAVQVVSRV